MRLLQKQVFLSSTICINFYSCTQGKRDTFRGGIILKGADKIKRGPAIGEPGPLKAAGRNQDRQQRHQAKIRIIWMAGNTGWIIAKNGFVVKDYLRAIWRVCP